jgi:hypothetical protein
MAEINGKISKPVFGTTIIGKEEVWPTIWMAQI